MQPRNFSETTSLPSSIVCTHSCRNTREFKGCNSCCWNSQKQPEALCQSKAADKPWQHISPFLYRGLWFYSNDSSELNGLMRYWKTTAWLHLSLLYWQTIKSSGNLLASVQTEFIRRQRPWIILRLDLQPRQKSSLMILVPVPKQHNMGTAWLDYTDSITSNFSNSTS